MNEESHENQPTSRLPSLFQHQERKQWGLAIVVRRLDDRVSFQFQDGTERTFHEKYLRLLVPVDLPYNEAAGIVESLRATTTQRSGGSERSSKSNRVPISLEEQIAFFQKEVGDFDDEEYTKTYRGDGRKRPLRRHRDAAIAKAKELLSKEAFEAAEQTPATMQEAALEVLTATDLVSVKERNALAAMDQMYQASFVEALRECLHGDKPMTVRVDTLVRVLERAIGKPPSWALSTSWLGLMAPEEHVVVRTDVFRRQAEWLAPSMSISNRPNGPVYVRVLSMVEGISEMLKEKGLNPRDLMDVHLFIWLTLKPTARKEIEKMRGTGRKSEAA